MPGRGTSGCAWCGPRPGAATTPPSRRRWPATACGCRRARACCCASWRAGRSAPSRAPSSAWAAGRLAAEGVRVLALIWDNASWHISREVRGWIRAHNRRAKAEGGCRLLVGRLPSKSPWLNPIEPRWVHGKRAVVEPERKLAAAELTQRLCAHYRCPLLRPLAQQVA